MRKRRVQVAIGVAISLLFLYLVLRDLDWAELWRLFAGGQYGYLVPGTVVLVIINLMRAYRWGFLLDGNAPLSLMWLFRLVNIGYLMNNIFPAKAGEVVRGILVGRQADGGVGRGLSTVLMERILDMLTVVVMLVVLLPFVQFPDWATTAAVTLGSIAAVGVVVMLVLARYGDEGVELLWRIVGRIPLVGSPKVRAGVADLVGGFGVLLNWRLAPALVITSALIWVGYALFNYIVMAVFGLAHLPFSAAAMVLVATGFGMAIPASPGGLGVFEWAAVQALLVFGVGQSQGAGYALGLHVYTMLVMIVLGLVGLMREGLSLGAARELAGSQAGAFSADETEEPSER